MARWMVRRWICRWAHQTWCPAIRIGQRRHNNKATATVIRAHRTRIKVGVHHRRDHHRNGQTTIRSKQVGHLLRFDSTNAICYVLSAHRPTFRLYNISKFVPSSRRLQQLRQFTIQFNGWRFGQLDMVAKSTKQHRRHRRLWPWPLLTFAMDWQCTIDHRPIERHTHRSR